MKSLFISIDREDHITECAMDWNWRKIKEMPMRLYKKYEQVNRISLRLILNSVNFQRQDMGK